MIDKSVPDIFRETITDISDRKFHIKPENDNTLCLREEKEDAKCRLVEIKLKKSISSFCFSIDVQPEKGGLDPIFPIFNIKKEGLCVKNDAILICQKQTKVYVFLIELKSGNKQDYLYQLKSAELLVNFIIDRVNLASDKPIIKKKQLEFRGLLFWCPRIKTEDTTRKRDRKKYKIEFTNRKGLLVADLNCSENIVYHLPQFLI